MILQTTGLTGAVRRGCRPIRRAGRLATAPLRELPTFIIIGVQKGGTSSLFEWIQSSPDVVPPASKEVHYFTRHYQCQFGWYKSYFPLRSLMGGRITGEATPYMLFHRDAPRRTAETLPECRFIVLLRNPVDRAWSHYWHEKRKGRETLSFEEAIEKEAERIASNDWGHQHFSYLSRGLYAEQLERWFSCYPPDRFLIMKSEDIFADPHSAVARVSNWLGILPGRVVTRALNVGTYQSTMDVRIRAELDAFFATDARRLRYLIGWSP